MSSEAKKQRNYKFIWTLCGKIFLSNDETSPLISVTNVYDFPQDYVDKERTQNFNVCDKYDISYIFIYKCLLI